MPLNVKMPLRTQPRTLPAEVSTIAFVGVVMTDLPAPSCTAPSATPGAAAIVAAADTPASVAAPERNSRRDVSVMSPPDRVNLKYGLAGFQMHATAATGHATGRRVAATARPTTRTAAA